MEEYNLYKMVIGKKKPHLIDGLLQLPGLEPTITFLWLFWGFIYYFSD